MKKKNKKKISRFDDGVNPGKTYRQYLREKYDKKIADDIIKKVIKNNYWGICD